MNVDRLISVKVNHSLADGVVIVGVYDEEGVERHYQMQWGEFLKRFSISAPENCPHVIILSTKAEEWFDATMALAGKQLIQHNPFLETMH